MNAAIENEQIEIVKLLLACSSIDVNQQSVSILNIFILFHIKFFNSILYKMFSYSWNSSNLIMFQNKCCHTVLFKIY